MGKTTVLFDLDNTLIDRDRAAKAALALIAERTFPQDPARQREFSRLGWLRDDSGDAPRLKMFQELRDYFGLPQPWVYEMKDFWLSEYPRKAAVFPDSRRVLEALRKRYKIGLVSNGSAKIQGTKMDIIGLADCFDMILYSGMIGIDKPDPRVFLEGCRRIGCRPEEAYFVGDLPWRDVAASQHAGLAPIHMCRPGHPECPGVPQIREIGELPALLRQLDK